MITSLPHDVIASETLGVGHPGWWQAEACESRGSPTPTRGLAVLTSKDLLSSWNYNSSPDNRDQFLWRKQQFWKVGFTALDLQRSLSSPNPTNLHPQIFRNFKTELLALKHMLSEAAGQMERQEYSAWKRISPGT